MQILVISDSHGDAAPVKTLLDQYAGKLTTVIHLGDNVKDILKFEHLYPRLNIVAVAGNCDYSAVAPRERILTLAGRRILLMHGHSHNVKMSCDRLIYYSMEKDVDACLFGHTHMSAIFTIDKAAHDNGPPSGEVFFMNPGSLCEPRGGSRAGYGIITIAGSNITGELIEL